MTKINFRKGKLTEEQKEFILKNYSHMKSNEICKILEIEYSQLKGYASDRRLVKDKYHAFKKAITNRQANENYNLCDYVCRTKEEKTSDIYKSKHGKYSLNQNYFSVIDNEFKAYWLGFLYADGCVRKDRSTYVLEVGLCEEDGNHLVKFLNSIQSDTVLKEKKIKNKYIAKKINICNNKLCEDLIHKGCVPRKSLTLDFPKEDILPKHLVKHFIRGYFDGDGCIYVNEELERCSISFVGTKEFLDEIVSVFHEELKLVKPSYSMTGKAYQIGWYGVANCEKIFKYLYSDCNIYLDRKIKKLDILFCLD